MNNHNSFVIAGQIQLKWVEWIESIVKLNKSVSE